MIEARDDGGAAFPQHGWTKDPEIRKHMAEAGLGMSLRDYFAAKALQGMASAPNFTVDIAGERLGIQRAMTAYVLADAMLAARSA